MRHARERGQSNCSWNYISESVLSRGCESQHHVVALGRGECFLGECSVMALHGERRSGRDTHQKRAEGEKKEMQLFFGYVWKNEILGDDNDCVYSFLIQLQQRTLLCPLHGVCAALSCMSSSFKNCLIISVTGRRFKWRHGSLTLKEEGERKKSPAQKKPS